MPLRRWRQPPTVFVTAAVGEVGADRDDRAGCRRRGSSSGVISEPPPIPVMPDEDARRPSPKTMISGSIRSDALDGLHVQPALGLVGAGPAALAAAARAGCRARSRSRRSPGRAAGCRAGRARGCSARGPRRSSRRAGCTSRSSAPRPSSTSLRAARVGRLLAADAGDPGVGAAQRALERRDLRGAAAVSAPRPRSPSASSTSTWTPQRSSKHARSQRLGEEHAGVDREDARLGRDVGSRSTRTDSSFWKEQASTRRGWWRSTASASVSRASSRQCSPRPRTRPRPG